MKIKKLNETDKALKLKIVLSPEQTLDDHGNIIYGFKKFIGWIPKSCLIFTNVSYGQKIDVKQWWFNKKIIPKTTFVEISR